MNTADVERLLSPAFSNRRAKAALRHYSRMVEDYQTEDWEDCIAKAGKFVEATLKTIADHCGVSVGTGRNFKVDDAINGLVRLSKGGFDDTLRLTIPRGCRFVYDIASNRGGRHDPDEVDPNHMDANVVVNVCAWIVSDLVRYSQKGKINLGEVRNLVESLTSKKYPFVEEIDGRAYVHLQNKSAVQVALVLLARKHPERISKTDLIASLERNGFSSGNARMAITRIEKLVDIDENDRLRLLAPGLKRAEEVLWRA